MKPHRIILLVDDDVDDSRFFGEAIREIDPSIRCTYAKDGIEALELLKLEEHLPDFIFLDLNMPRLSGQQFLARLKKIDRLKSIPVIIYSTTRQPEDVEETSRLGAVYFLTKPATFEKICEAILFVLEERWQEKEFFDHHV